MDEEKQCLVYAEPTPQMEIKELQRTWVNKGGSKTIPKYQPRVVILPPLFTHVRCNFFDLHLWSRFSIYQTLLSLRHSMNALRLPTVDGTV